MSEKILLIDDEPDIRVIAELGLARVGGMTVFTAADGDTGVQVALDERPDAILLDAMMPKVDGPTTYKNLRAKGVDVPVIFLTARVQTHEVQEYLDLGAAGVIRKPFDPLTLASEVRRLLGGTG